MTFTLTGNKTFNISATEVAFDRENHTIWFGRTINSTVVGIKMACTDEQFIDRLEKTRQLKDTDFAWMASL